VLAYALRRLLRSIPLLLGLSLVVFALIHAAPGGPLSVYLENPHVRPEDVERLKRSLGLDRPLHEQYLRWLAAFVQGDWGYSYVDGRRALTRVMERVPATLELMAVAISLALFFASALALVGSMHRGRAADRATLLVSLGGISVPTFWLGLMLQLVFAVGLGWFPSAGRQSPLRTDLLDRASHLVLPAVTLAVFYAASWTRYLRGSLVEAMEEPYLRAGEARGLSGWRMVLRHALPNALIPFVTVLAIDLALVFSGAVVTETVFAWPGMGSLLVESVHRRDYTVLMGLVMAGAALVLASSLATDILYGVLDPRVRVGGGGAGGQRVRS
jgi:peptide/nickel transport system permease protein